ncbi:MAG TPA: DUF3325 domain-containing protein [Steroidobacteraceae bacterium]|nr:DUF3325 domain-containing protein [Steroidobacteraceae bacterium]
MMLLLAFFLSFVGLALLALAMERHWRQLRATEPLTNSTARLLRIGGSIALASSLALCLTVDHASMASLVWIMTLAVSAFVLAMLLAWCPGWLAPLIAWTGVKG